MSGSRESPASPQVTQVVGVVVQAMILPSFVMMILKASNIVQQSFVSVFVFIFYDEAEGQKRYKVVMLEYIARARCWGTLI